MKILLWIVVVCAAVVVAICGWLGAFQTVVIGERLQGPSTLVYREMTGTNMKTVGDITTGLAATLDAAGITQRKPMDVFFPDGRAEIGFEVDGTTPAKLATLGDGIKARELPVQKYMYTMFPWKNPASFMVGFFKVDKALAEYRRAHGFKKVEAITINGGKTIVYLQPIVKE